MAQRQRNHARSKFGLFANMAVLCLTFIGPANAQEKKGAAPATTPAKPAAPQQAKQKAPAWSVRCTNPGKGLTCKATHTIVLGKTRRLLLSVSVSKPTEGKNAAMLLHLPHRLFDPAGVTLGIDAAKPETFQIQTCDAGSIAAPRRASSAPR